MPGSEGPKPTFVPSPMRDSVPAVLPWKPPQKDRNSYFLVNDLARRSAASTASAPLE